MSFLDSLTGSCVTNAGYVASSLTQASAITGHAVVDAAIQTVIALWQRNASKKIQEMQQEIADQQVALAEEVQAHAALFWPEERELVNDAFAAGVTVPQYVALMNEFGGLAQASLQDGRDDWVEAMRDMCMAPSRCEDARWQRFSAMLTADMHNYGARQEEARAQVLNDRRYARQYSILGMGRGAFTQMLSYQAIAGASAGVAGSMLASTVNSALEAFGYYPTRRAASGWGSGIQETWSKTYMPTAMPVEKQAIPVDKQPVQNIEPIARPRFTPVRAATKDNEFDDLGKDVAELQRMRTGGLN
jgi:hypothetical protein